MLEKALEEDDADAQLHNYYGIVANARGDHEGAVTALKRAAELDPGHTEAMINLAILLSSAEEPRLPEARKYYTMAIEAGAAPDPQLEALLGE